MKTPKLCFDDRLLDVRLYQLGVDHFAVQYGKQVTEGLTYADAAKELGAAIMHALSCEACVDNAEPKARYPMRIVARRFTKEFGAFAFDKIKNVWGEYLKTRG